jgi:hypothetical protein
VWDLPEGRLPVSPSSYIPHGRAQPSRGIAEGRRVGLHAVSTGPENGLPSVLQRSLSRQVGHAQINTLLWQPASSPEFFFFYELLESAECLPSVCAHPLPRKPPKAEPS